MKKRLFQGAVDLGFMSEYVRRCYEEKLEQIEALIPRAVYAYAGLFTITTARGSDRVISGDTYIYFDAHFNELFKAHHRLCPEINSRNDAIEYGSLPPDIHFAGKGG